MKILKLTILICPLLTILPQISEARQAQTMSFDATTSLMLAEFQAMLTFEEETISVAMRLGRGESTPGVDRLEQGDIILMMNGKRATDIEGLREMYDAINADEEIKIGVRRGEERFILTAIKGAVPEGNGMRMVMNFDDDGSGERPVISQSLGLLLADEDENVVIQRLIPPMMPEPLKGLGIQGYSITEFNGQKPESAAWLLEQSDAVAIGEEITITFEKDGDEQSITFTKAEPTSSFSIGHQ